MDILALLQCLAPILSVTTIRQLSRLIFALLAMTGRVTLRGISRWAGPGGSYRRVQRWFYTAIPWGQVFVRFFRQHLFHSGEVYILAGDEVVVTQAGKQTLRLRSGQALWPGPLFLQHPAKAGSQRRLFCPVASEYRRARRVPALPGTSDPHRG